MGLKSLTDDLDCLEDKDIGKGGFLRLLMQNSQNNIERNHSVMLKYHEYRVEIPNHAPNFRG